MTSEVHPRGKLRRRYRRLNRHGIEALSAGQLTPDRVPQDGSERWGLSVVALINGQAAEAMAKVAAEGAVALTPADIVHSEHTLHLTVRTLEHHRVQIDRDDECLISYRRALGSVAGRAEPFELDFEGLVVTSGGVLAAGYPRSGALADLRAALHVELDSMGLAGPPEKDRVRDTAHASLAVFMSGDPDRDKLMAWCERHRNRPFPAQRVDRLAIVQYQFRPFAVVPLHVADLGPIACS